ncbi:hypothetical protein [Raineyella fluvialis]|uniref:Uncharacterized protein n=1 Tax=Raineyella fluvialis TaxID=2662261 RepID=A0A5Q2F8U2_9ACTN|nr:hypothetical protein [Raineyella fluvialis]QGF23322.1 hypothetical protein Rai3103_06205 [Raineyella fluvialis]
MSDDPQEQADGPLEDTNAASTEWDDRMDELLHRSTVPPMPEPIRRRLEVAIREAQAEREAGELAQAHREALVAAAKRTALGTFGPNPIHPRSAFRGGWPRARTIGA